MHHTHLCFGFSKVSAKIKPNNKKASRCSPLYRDLHLFFKSADPTGVKLRGIEEVRRLSQGPQKEESWEGGVLFAANKTFAY